MRIKPGFGYWDVTSYPLGGSFHRAPAAGLKIVKIERIYPRGLNTHGTNAVGVTADGRKVAFDTNHTEGEWNS